MKTNKTRDELIVAGIREADRYGIANFSIRRVATECGVSCATPYKHFKDRNDFIFAMLRYINQKWYSIQREILIKYPGDTRKRIVEISIAYINFLLDNPNFRTMIMESNHELTEEQIQERSNLSQCTLELIESYCREVNMAEDVKARKLFIIRSIVYGASIMIDNGQMERCEQTFKMVEKMIEREFEIP